YVDALGFRVTTNQGCAGGGATDTTISPLPVTDTFDPTQFSFVSSSPAPSNSVSTINSTGIIQWADVGPLVSGGTKSISVTLQAKQPSSNGVTATNTATVVDAKYLNGRDTNEPTSSVN